MQFLFYNLLPKNKIYFTVAKKGFIQIFSPFYFPSWPLGRRLRSKLPQRFFIVTWSGTAIDPLEWKSHSGTFYKFFLPCIIGSAFLCKVQWGSLAYLKRMGPVLLRQLFSVTFLIKSLQSDEELPFLLDKHLF